jgi:hypothetical protein
MPSSPCGGKSTASRVAHFTEGYYIEFGIKSGIRQGQKKRLSGHFGAILEIRNQQLVHCQRRTYGDGTGLALIHHRRSTFPGRLGPRDGLKRPFYEAFAK